jgi:putative transposase
VQGSWSTRPSQRYQPQENEEETRLIQAMLELVAKHPRYGYRFIWALLRKQGWRGNRKRIYRLCGHDGLKISILP